LSSQLPDTHKQRIVRDFLTKFLVIEFAGVDKTLEATEGSTAGIGEVNNVLDFVLVMLGELFAVVGRLGA